MLRKTLSLAMVVALCLSVTAFAADPLPRVDDPAGIEFEVDGEIIYIDLDGLFDVVLPTANVLAFTLDPQGLSGIESGSTGAIGSSGAVVGPTDAALMINYSPVPVNVTMTYKGVSTAGGTEESPGAVAKFVGSEADVASGTENNIYLTLIPSSTKVTAEDGTGYLAATKVFVASDKAATANFVLAAAPYEVTNTDGTYTAAIKQSVEGTDDLGEATGFKVGGKVNADANWADFNAETTPSKVSLDMAFTFAKDTTEYETADFETGVFGLLAGPKYEGPGFIVDDATVNATTATYTRDPETGLDVAFYFGDQTISSVTWKNGANTSTMDAKYYSKGDNVFTIDKSFISTSSVGTRIATITLSGGGTFNVTITIK